MPLWFAGRVSGHLEALPEEIYFEAIIDFMVFEDHSKLNLLFMENSTKGKDKDKPLDHLEIWEEIFYYITLRNRRKPKRSLGTTMNLPEILSMNFAKKNSGTIPFRPCIGRMHLPVCGMNKIMKGWSG